MQDPPTDGTDAFISHASADTAVAEEVEGGLERAGLSAWLDRSDIRVGTLLRNELKTSIEAARVTILLWSATASASRWVKAEVLTAFHLDRFIVPYVLDRTPPPHFLENAIFLDHARDPVDRLPDAVRRAPAARNEVPPFLARRSAELERAIQGLATGQKLETDALGADKVEIAREVHATIDPDQRAAEERWGLDATVLNLGGYHRKNAYMIEHWDAIQAGRAPKDPQLVEAERFFLETLLVNPVDYSALNGLGSILIFERDIDAAEFFVSRALEYAERDGVDYTAAKHDLALIERYKRG